MKKSILFLFALMGICLLWQSCDNYKTYAEMLKEERESIERFISRKNIKVISRDQFLAQDSTTNVANNEYVLFTDNGIYMQIVYEGEGQKVESGQQVLTRFVEVDVASGDTIWTNMFDVSSIDEFRYERTGNSISATFVSDDGRYGVYSMARKYGSSVPAGWLIPLEYVNLTRNTSKIARVNLIVPSKMGQSDAIEYVYACHYELTYQLSR